MRICIDSCVFIRGIRDDFSDASELLDQVGSIMPVVIPRLVALEVTRNLFQPIHVKTFYQRFTQNQLAFIVDEPVPRDLVLKYTQLGLPQKADAFIGAFGEWMQIAYLISDNRHFLRELETNAYNIVTPAEFLSILTKG